MHVRLSSLAILLGVLTLAPQVGAAQQPVAARQSAGPRIEATAAGIRRAHADVRADSAQATSAALAQRQSMGRPVALMVVGGAAVVLGAVIGDAPGTLFMIGGTVAFLYGLYQYLQ